MNIAILGGTFNPIHLGHITMAQYVLENMDIDKICFLPNGQPPHKKSTEIIDKHHRLQMVKLATDYNDNFYISDYEINQDKNCYTVDTIKYFNSLGDDKYYFIIGADSLLQLSSWKNADELKKICSFIVCDRGDRNDTSKEVERLKADGCDIILTNMPKIHIDSTTIRKKARLGMDISEYVPHDVNQYIIKNRLYL